jgi:hypothetical protein
MSTLVSSPACRPAALSAVDCCSPMVPRDAKLALPVMASICLAANIPPLAGRSPSYIVRQLILFRSGRRISPASLPMQQVAAALTVQDMCRITP